MELWKETKPHVSNKGKLNTLTLLHSPTLKACKKLEIFRSSSQPTKSEMQILMRLSSDWRAQ